MTNFSSVSQIREKIKNNKNVRNYTPEEFEFLQTTVGRAIYNHKPTTPPQTRNRGDKRLHWSDKIKCEICGKEYGRSNSSAHKGSKFHRKAEEQKMFDTVIANAKELIFKKDAK